MSEHDEYGLEKPHQTWMERGNEWIRPKEGAGAAEQIGRALAAAPVLIGGHVLDSYPGLNGGYLPGEAGHIDHSYKVEEYQRQRRDAEAQAKQAEQAREQASGPEGECNPDTGDEVPYYLKREPTYEWMAD